MIPMREFEKSNSHGVLVRLLKELPDLRQEAQAVGRLFKQFF